LHNKAISEQMCGIRRNIQGATVNDTPRAQKILCTEASAKSVPSQFSHPG